MYGIWKWEGLRKVRQCQGAEFATILDALDRIARVYSYEYDNEHDAADVITIDGTIYAIEKV